MDAWQGLCGRDGRGRAAGAGEGGAPCTGLGRAVPQPPRGHHATGLPGGPPPHPPGRHQRFGRTWPAAPLPGRGHRLVRAGLPQAAACRPCARTDAPGLMRPDRCGRADAPGQMPRAGAPGRRSRRSRCGCISGMRHEGHTVGTQPAVLRCGPGPRSWLPRQAVFASARLLLASAAAFCFSGCSPPAKRSSSASQYGFTCPFPGPRTP